MLSLTPKEKANEILKLEVHYWGQKGLVTTQRASMVCNRVNTELIALSVSQDIIDYWNEVNLEIYKQGE